MDDYFPTGSLDDIDTLGENPEFVFPEAPDNSNSLFPLMAAQPIMLSVPMSNALDLQSWPFTALPSWDNLSSNTTSGIDDTEHGNIHLHCVSMLI